MTRTYPAALRHSHRVLRLLVMLNIAYGVAILALLVASLVAEGPVMSALGVRPAPDRATIVRGMRLIAVAGLVSVPVAHLILTRLLAMVETVRAGDAFVLENAGRLRTMAWAVLGMTLLHVVVGAIAAGSGSSVQPLDINWTFSVTPLLVVLLLFVLAGVFEQGARMRADLEGTV